jgi:hypothetical protein
MRKIFVFPIFRSGVVDDDDDDDGNDDGNDDGDDDCVNESKYILVS